METEEKKRARLHMLFAQLRKMKQIDLMMADREKDPVSRARSAELAMTAIRKVEDEIEREMNEC